MMTLRRAAGEKETPAGKKCNREMSGKILPPLPTRTLTHPAPALRSHRPPQKHTQNPRVPLGLVEYPMRRLRVKIHRVALRQLRHHTLELKRHAALQYQQEFLPLMRHRLHSPSLRGNAQLERIHLPVHPLVRQGKIPDVRLVPIPLHLLPPVVTHHGHLRLLIQSVQQIRQLDAQGRANLGQGRQRGRHPEILHLRQQALAQTGHLRNPIQRISTRQSGGFDPGCQLHQVHCTNIHPVMTPPCQGAL